MMDNILSMRLVGPFQIHDSLGQGLTPRGQKSCGLLALLALAPDFTRSRKWLQDKLWSDRGEEQGAASLRQTLTEIRRSFGKYRDCIQTDRSIVQLNPQLVHVEELTIGFNITESQILDDMILLDGLDVKDSEFENWLREQRIKFEELKLKSGNPANVFESCRTQTELDSNSNSSAHLILMKHVGESSGSDAILANMMSDAIAKTVCEMGTVDVVDWRTYCDPKSDLETSIGNRGNLAVQTEYSSTKSGGLHRVFLFNPITNHMIWSTSVPCTRGSGVDYVGTIEDLDTLRSLNIAAAVINQELNENIVDEIATAKNYCFAGIKLLFKLGAKNIYAADDMFEAAYDIDKRGIYLAWRAYLRTFLIAERECISERATSEEALELMRNALDLEPHNSFVLGLCAHVQAITQNSIPAAYELARRSLDLNAANPFAWICLGVAESQVGDPKIAFEYALRARKIAGTTPFAYHIDTLSCVIGILSGNLEGAQHFGEASHGIAPNFAAPMRFLTGLYFYKKEHDHAERMITKLRDIEPDFSLELLHDQSYPCESLRRSILIDSIPSCSP